MKKFTLVFIVLCFVAEFGMAQKADCPKGINPSDATQLEKFYNQTSGLTWKSKNNWLNFSSTDWYGVRWKTIDGECRVDSLILNYNHMEGTLPNMNFPHLRFLMLSSNYIKGQIPDFDLPELQHLYLSTNRFTGTLPAFSKLKKLEVLYARNNEGVGGQLPLFDLPLLRELRLENCAFTGVVPNWNLPSLEILDLNCNPLDSFAAPLLLPKMVDLNISHNKKLKIAPFFVQKQPNLKILDISGIGFDFFKDKFIYPNLESLIAEAIWRNSSEITPQFFPNLKKLKISESGIKGSLAFVKKLPLLEVLDARSNEFSSFDLDGLENHPLKELNLYYCSIRGDLAVLNSFPQLEKVDLSSNQMDQCSKKVKLDFVKEIDLSRNSLNFSHLDSLTFLFSIIHHKEDSILLPLQNLMVQRCSKHLLAILMQKILFYGRMNLSIRISKKIL